MVDRYIAPFGHVPRHRRVNWNKLWSTEPQNKKVKMHYRKCLNVMTFFGLLSFIFLLLAPKFDDTRAAIGMVGLATVSVLVSLVARFATFFLGEEVQPAGLIDGIQEGEILKVVAVYSDPTYIKGPVIVVKKNIGEKNVRLVYIGDAKNRYIPEAGHLVSRQGENLVSAK